MTANRLIPSCEHPGCTRTAQLKEIRCGADFVYHAYCTRHRWLRALAVFIAIAGLVLFGFGVAAFLSGCSPRRKPQPAARPAEKRQPNDDDSDDQLAATNAAVVTAVLASQ